MALSQSGDATAAAKPQKSARIVRRISHENRIFFREYLIIQARPGNSPVARSRHCGVTISGSRTQEPDAYKSDSKKSDSLF